MEAQRDTRGPAATVQARCPEHLDGEAFYAGTGNQYHGEFRALAEVWGGGVAREALGRVEYSRPAARSHRHLRRCAWMDACSHLWWWDDHGGRPAYAASVRSYHVLRMDSIGAERHLWGHMTRATPDSDERQLSQYDCERRALMRAEGLRVGFFQPGWLEGRRAKRHTYVVEWEPLDPPEKPVAAPCFHLVGGNEPRFQDDGRVAFVPFEKPCLHF